MSDLIQNITDDTFQKEILDYDTPVLIDFWAEWCSPCRALTPILEEVAPSFSGKVKFVKINVDENTRTPAKYGVRSIPTLVIIRDGQLIGSQIGLLNKNQLIDFLNQTIA